jgi:hypothetical protein
VSWRPRLLRHWRLIVEEPLDESALALNPDVTAALTMEVEVPVAIHDHRLDPYRPAVTAMRTGHPRCFDNVGWIWVFGFGHERRTRLQQRYRNLPAVRESHHQLRRTVRLDVQRA